MSLKVEPVENLMGVGDVTMNKPVEAAIAIEAGADEHGRALRSDG